MKEKIVLFLFATFISLSLKAEKNNDSLYISLNAIQLDSKVILKSFEGKITEKKEQLTDAQFLKLNQKGLTVSKEFGFDTIYFKFIDEISTFYFYTGELVKEQEYLEGGLAHALSINNPNYITRLYSKLGGNLLQQGKYVKGINQLLIGADYAIKHKNEHKDIEKIQYVAYLNLGFAFSNLGEMEESLKYSFKAKNYFEANNDLSPLATTYQFISHNYEELGKRDSSDFYMFKVSELVKKLNTDSLYRDDMHNITYNLAAIASYYLETNNIDSAKVYYNELANLNFGNKDYQYILDLNYALLLNDLAKAKTLIDAAPKDLSPIFSERHYELKAMYYETIGNYRESIVMYKSYYNAEKEDLKNHRIKWKDFTDTKLDMFQQEKDIIELESKQQYQSQLLKLFGGVIFLVLIILFLAAFAYFQTRKNLNNSLLIEKQSGLLQKAEQQKNKLLNNIAHELQTPLSIILGLSNQKVKDLNNAQDFFQIISRNTRHLSDSINQMLSFNKANEQQSKTLQKKLFNLSDFFQFLIPEYYFLANQKEIQFIKPHLDKFDLLIYTDIEKLAIILKNLLSNAIKYTKRQGQVQLIYTSEEEAFHTFKVKDNGRGIPSSEWPYIFERNFQSAIQETQGGFGLGLAICKEYATILNGEIEFESQEGKGTTFTIRIPKLAKEEISKLSTSHSLFQFPIMERPEPTILKKEEGFIEENHEILIVEDNLDFCKYLESILDTSYNLTFVHSGEEAIVHLTNHQPALIITDWMMAGMDGLSLVKQLRSSDNETVPILMLTARSLLSDELKAFSAGVNEYLVKPIDETVFLHKIKHLLDLSDSNQNLSSFIAFQASKAKISQLSQKDQDWLLKVENHIRLNLQNFEYRLTNLAGEMKIGQTHLNNKIKLITGMTSKNFIQEIRYWEARRLLEENRIDSVKALSLTVGFKDIKNFSRNFKKRFDKYPNEYLKVN